jgi:two-component sensor histidine kinase
VPTLKDLAERHTGLRAEDLAWLHLLLADWQLLADLSFADLVLWLPTREGDAFVAVAQMRPTTGPTVYHADLVGEIVPRGRRPQLDMALEEARICRERDPEWRDEVPFREETIPVVREGVVVAVISRHTNLAAARTPSRLELTYLRTADDLAQMVAEGRFPSATSAVLHASPRVGDGLARLDRSGVVTYASPNALSAYRRLGLTGNLVGTTLGELTAGLAPTEGPVEESLEALLSGRAPREAEVEGGGAVLFIRLIPLDPGGVRIGALVLIRDVTDLRRRERELLSKDATIREIHHRVKNNLQTVAALLRLQARRVPAGVAREALTEAVRRVGAIAVVHESLSHGDAEGLGDAVDGDEVVDRLIASLGEVARDTEATVGATMRRAGCFGRLDAEVATPLTLVLAELLQNALEHGLPAGGTVTIEATRRATGTAEGERLRVVVTDDGRGLPAGFTLEDSTSLGLQIVRTLVRSELGGTIELCPREGGGVAAVLDLPLPAARR